MQNITHEKLYHSFLSGAKEVMNNRAFLNKINVFPVADGDTGSNLFSLMHSIVHYAELKETAKKTIDSIADAAIIGARGNSGLIFAQYVQGFSRAMPDEPTISNQQFINASKEAVKSAYLSLERPVEGTMLTAMHAFYDELTQAIIQMPSFDDAVDLALQKVEQAVKETTNQLKSLKKSAVVDSGAQGFSYFIKGFLSGLRGEDVTMTNERFDEVLEPIMTPDHDFESLTYRYCTEALIHKGKNVLEAKTLLKDLGDSIVQVDGVNKMRVHMHTNQPSEMFKRLSTTGKILEQKVDDMVEQYERVHNRKYKTVIMTDSIADLPQEFIDEAQVHVVNLPILVGDTSYFDKLTISNEQLFKLAKETGKHPTSSQPSIKQIENSFRYLLSYYDEIIVFSVARALSGTHRVFEKAKETFVKDSDRIHIIDTKQNSVAQGLLVYEAIQQLKQKVPTTSLVKQAKQSIKDSKILVNIHTLDNMIASGRLSVRAGKLAKKVGLRPIVTLDETGAGGIFKIAFNPKTSLNKIMRHLKKINETKGIKYYAITYVDDQARGQAFGDELSVLLNKKPAYITKSSGIIAMGAGMGAVAVAYITK